MPPDLLGVVRNYQAQLDSLNADAVARLVANYQASWRRLEAMLQALIAEIGEGTPTQGQLVRMTRYQSLMQQIQNELLGLQTLTGNEIELAADAAIDISMAAVNDMFSQVYAGFNVLPKEAAKSLLGFLDPTGPLYARLMELAAFNADAVAQVMIQGITLGWNPRKIARMVQREFAGGLNDALRFVRTAQLYAYRESNRANFVNNGIDSWVWHAHFDDRTCGSCMAMHGTVHPSTEILNDHHNGRCAMVPLVPGYDNPVTQTGPEWFEQQSEATQRGMLGKGKFEAWKAGKFKLSDLPEDHEDGVYGMMKTERALYRLLGADAPLTQAQIRELIGT